MLLLYKVHEVYLRLTDCNKYEMLNTTIKRNWLTEIFKTTFIIMKGNIDFNKLKI